jgi:hypothetical protein
MQQYAQSLFGAEFQLVQTDIDHSFVVAVKLKAQHKAVLVKCTSRLCTETESDNQIASQTAERMGGAGMDVLLARGQCLWSWPADESTLNPLLAESQATMAAVFAMTELGCVLLPDHSRLVGLRGVREWLEQQQPRE